MVAIYSGAMHTSFTKKSIKHNSCLANSTIFKWFTPQNLLVRSHYIAKWKLFDEH